jgi:glycosyltransferase involved in cell wall biosynthesis
MGLEFAGRYGRGPIVYTNHTRYDLYTGAYTGLPQNVADGLMMRIWPYMTNYCHTIISPSNSLKRVLRDFGVRKPIVVIHNGIELDRYRRESNVDVRQLYNIPATAILFISVSRLSPEKRAVALLREFAEVAKINPSYHLLLVGSGASRRQLKRLVNELGLNDQIYFAGAISPEYIPDYLAAADVFVTASVSEVHPLAVIEAMAAGLPVAGISSPGLDDTVEHESSGLLVGKDDGALALAMKQIGRSRDRRLAMGENAWTMSQRFDISVTVERTLDLYQNLLATSASTHFRNSQEYRSGTQDYPGARH